MFLALVLKNFLNFHTFQEKETPKKFFILQEKGTLESFLSFRKLNFSTQARKNKNKKKIHPLRIVIFQETELSDSMIKKVFEIRPCTF